MVKPVAKGNKVALCLAGGGITGSMFEIGCLKAVDDSLAEPHTVNQFDIFVGISAGAIVSALIANGYTPRELFDVILEDKNSPPNFKRKNIYNLPLTDFVRSIMPLFTRLPSLIRYGWVNRRHATLMDLISIMQEFIPPGIFSLKNLDKFVAAALYPEGKTNDFRNLERELYIPATNLDTGQRWVFGEDDDTVPISKAVAASAAIPLFFRPVRINGQDFIDGSTGQVSHVDIAIRNGAKLIVIINPTVPIENDRNKNCLPTFDGTCGRLSEKGMGFISDQARRIETKTRFELGFERFKQEHPDIDYIVIQPHQSEGFLFLHGVMEYDSRKAILNYGYYTTISQMTRNFAQYKGIFAKHKIKVKEQ
ncbi:MAG: patatin-like phospholipase family protein [bacterium]